MGKKKILIVINSLGLGGAEKSLVSLLSLFDYDKYDIDLQMFRPEGVFMELLPEEVNVLPQLPYFSFMNESTLKQLLSFKPQYFNDRLKLFFNLRKNNKNNHYYHDAQVFWNSCHKSIKKSNIKYDVAIAWGQGNPTHYVAEKVDATIKIAWINADYELAGHKKEFDNSYYKKYNKIVTVSSQLCQIEKNVFSEYRDKIITILDIQNYDLVKNMSNFDLPYSYKNTNTIKIVTCGRLNETKGYDLAVEAANILKEQEIDFEWLFVGEGPKHLELQSQIDNLGLQDNVKLVGLQSNPYPFINSCDIYVQTSRFEGYCLTLAEARMLNKPIVTTNFDVVNVQIKNMENGIIVDIDSKAIADGIVQLINDRQLQEKLVNNLMKEKKGNLEEFDKVLEIIND